MLFCFSDNAQTPFNYSEKGLNHLNSNKKQSYTIDSKHFTHTTPHTKPSEPPFNYSEKGLFYLDTPRRNSAPNLDIPINNHITIKNRLTKLYLFDTLTPTGGGKGSNKKKQ